MLFCARGTKLKDSKPYKFVLVVVGMKAKDGGVSKMV